MKKYSVEGIETVGVWGSEKFEIHFHNKSVEDAQITISLDGTNVLTGKPASLEVSKDMWIVRAGKTLHLKAWCENNKGGAAFVFTNGDKSVSLNAHGNVSHNGIISAAVFTEKNPPPKNYPVYYGMTGVQGSSSSFGGSGMQTNSYSRNIPSKLKGIISTFNSSKSDEISESSSNSDKKDELKSSASVGAGEYVEQTFNTVKGLNEPILNSIVRVRYVWYDDLVKMLEKGSDRFVDPFPTGFPAEEKIKTFADLSKVPRVESSSFGKEKSSFSRFV